MSGLTQNQTDKLLPILKHFVQAIKKRGSLSEKQIEIFLESVDLQNAEWAKSESLKWANLLLRYKNAEDIDEQDAIEISLEARGIPQANLTLALSELDKKETVFSEPLKSLSISVKVLNFGQLEPNEKKEISFSVEGGPGNIENSIQCLKLSKTNFGIEKEEIKAVISGGSEGEQIADSIYLRTNNEVKEVIIIADWIKRKSEIKVETVSKNTISKEGKLNNVSTIESNNAETYYNRGKLFMEKSNFENAIDQFIKAISIQPNNAEYIINLAHSYRFKGKYDQAIENYKKAISIEPGNSLNSDDFAWTYNLLGNRYYSQGYYDQAIENYKKAISIQPNNNQYITNLENTYKLQGKFPKSEKNKPKGFFKSLFG